MDLFMIAIRMWFDFNVYKSTFVFKGIFCIAWSVGLLTSSSSTHICLFTYLQMPCYRQITEGFRICTVLHITTYT